MNDATYWEESEAAAQADWDRNFDVYYAPALAELRPQFIADERKALREASAGHIFIKLCGSLKEGDQPTTWSVNMTFNGPDCEFCAVTGATLGQSELDVVDTLMAGLRAALETFGHEQDDWDMHFGYQTVGMQALLEAAGGRDLPGVAVRLHGRAHDAR